MDIALKDKDVVGLGNLIALAKGKGWADIAAEYQGVLDALQRGQLNTPSDYASLQSKGFVAAPTLNAQLQSYVDEYNQLTKSNPAAIASLQAMVGGAPTRPVTSSTPRDPATGLPLGALRAYASGGPVTETGPIFAHEGEYVLNRDEVAAAARVGPPRVWCRAGSRDGCRRSRGNGADHRHPARDLARHLRRAGHPPKHDVAT